MSSLAAQAFGYYFMQGTNACCGALPVLCLYLLLKTNGVVVLVTDELSRPFVITLFTSTRQRSRFLTRHPDPRLRTHIL